MVLFDERVVRRRFRPSTALEICCAEGGPGCAGQYWSMPGVKLSSYLLLTPLLIGALCAAYGQASDQDLVIRKVVVRNGIELHQRQPR